MTKEEAELLERQKQKCVDNYTSGALKGMQPILKSTAKFAYIRAQNDLLRMLSQEGWDIVRTASPVLTPEGDNHGGN